MAFKNRLATIVPSMGTPHQKDSLYLSEGNAITGSISVTMASLSPTVRAGYVRVRIYGAAGTSPTLTNLQLVFSDGTTSVSVYNSAPETALAYALSTTATVDRVVPFLLEINATTLTISGALGGTSPTGSMDVEICPTAGNA